MKMKHSDDNNNKKRSRHSQTYLISELAAHTKLLNRKKPESETPFLAFNEIRVIYLWLLVTVVCFSL